MEQLTLFTDSQAVRDVFWGVDLSDYVSKKREAMKDFITKAIASPSPTIKLRFIIEVLSRIEQGEISEQYLEREITNKIRINSFVEECDIIVTKNKILQWEYHYGQLTKEDIEVFLKKYPSYSRIFDDRMDPIRMFKILEKCVKGQDEALLKLCLNLYEFNFYCDSVLRDEKMIKPLSSCLLIGDTGSGKTFMTKKLAELIKLRFIYVDCSRAVSQGYYGLNIVTEILSQINEPKTLKKEIILLDEIDKLICGDLEVKTSVLNELLSLLDRKSESLRGYVGYGKDHSEVAEVDTNFFYFILAGTFSSQRKRQKRASIGFGKDYCTAENIDLNSLGLPRELVGRIGSVIEMNPIKKETLINIIKHSEDSPLRYYKQFFRKHNHPFNISEDEVSKIADRALKMGAGARGLDSTLKEYYSDKILAMFE